MRAGVRKGVDLVLLDLNLPGMDGLEVCRLIRRQPTTAHVRRLRLKLGPARHHVETVVGIGYRFVN